MCQQGKDTGRAAQSQLGNSNHPGKYWAQNVTLYCNSSAQLGRVCIHVELQCPDMCPTGNQLEALYPLGSSARSGKNAQ